ncbi:hypothetical protein DL98DRAFT_588284 [Cadophora sp. DSE1049]|nr:hypothetical protein DL98DRAFT_588284 [Cadophora sp. DSE1049]
MSDFCDHPDMQQLVDWLSWQEQDASTGTEEVATEENADAHENAIKDLELKYQQALSEKQDEVKSAKAVVSQTFQRFYQMSAQTKKAEEQMKTMQVEMQQMTATIDSLNHQLRSAGAANAPSPSEPTGFEDFFNDPSNWTDSPTSTQSSNFTDITNAFEFTYETPQTFTPAQPFTPQNPAQQYFYGNSPPITPVPSKKRKAPSEPFIGQFYQCRQLYDYKDPKAKGKEAKDGRTLFCGVINNQFMAGGKSDGEPRQRCVSKVCRKYTDIKDKHWVEGWVVDMYGVGVQAPMDTPKLGAAMGN